MSLRRLHLFDALPIPVLRNFIIIIYTSLPYMFFFTVIVCRFVNHQATIYWERAGHEVITFFMLNSAEHEILPAHKC